MVIKTYHPAFHTASRSLLCCVWATWTVGGRPRAMGRSAAARREKRQMKRDVAKSTRTTKYANQKGGGVQKPRHRARPLPSRERAAADDDGESIAVIRGGKAVWARADGNIGRADAAVDVTGMGEERDDDDSAVKKLRALRKKLRRVQELRQRRAAVARNSMDTKWNYCAKSQTLGAKLTHLPARWRGRKTVATMTRMARACGHMAQTSNKRNHSASRSRQEAMAPPPTPVSSSGAH